MNDLEPLPATAAWRHVGPREGTEVLVTEATVGGHRLTGHTTAVNVDLESSAVTNTLPVHRLSLPLGEPSDVPAAFVRATDLRVERLEQTWERLETAGQVAYTSSTFDVRCTLTYDGSGLVVDHPGIAQRLR